MTEEKQPTAGPSFTNNQSGDGAVNKQGMEIVEGDKAETIDKSQHSTTETNVAGDMHGDIKGGDNIQGGVTNNAEQAVKDFFDEMIANAPEQKVVPRAIPQPEATVETTTDAAPEMTEELPAPVLIEDFESIEEVQFENDEDHPAAVYASFQSYSSAPPEEVPTEEEQKSLYQRMTSCVKKYATTENAQKLCATAAGAIEVVAGGLPFPWNLTKFLLSKASGKE